MFPASRPPPRCCRARRLVEGGGTAAVGREEPGDAGRPRRAGAKKPGRRAWRSPRSCRRRCSPTSRRRPPSRPITRCTRRRRRRSRTAGSCANATWCSRSTGSIWPVRSRPAWGDAPIGAKVIRVSPDAHVHRGWSLDYQGLPPSDVYLMCEPDVAVPLLLEQVRARPAAVLPRTETKLRAEGRGGFPRALARAFNELTAGMDVCLSKLPLGWNGAYRHFRHPLDYLGADGGGGVGAGPGLPWARRSRSREAAAWWWASSATATSSWGTPRSGPPRTTGCPASSSSPTTARSTTTSCTRSAWRRSAAGRWRTNGSASASTSPTSTSRRWRARRARWASGR